MSWIAVGVVGAGALAAGGTAYAANSAKQASKAANKSAAEQAQANNEYNYRMYKESRESSLSDQYTGLEDSFASDIADIYARQRSGFDADSLLSKYNLTSAYNSYKQQAEAQKTSSQQSLLNTLPTATSSKVRELLAKGYSIDDIVTLGTAGTSLSDAEVENLSKLNTQYLGGLSSTMTSTEWLEQYASNNPTSAVASEVTKATTSLSDQTSSELADATSDSNKVISKLMSGDTGDGRLSLYQKIADARSKGAEDVNATSLEGVNNVNATRLAGLKDVNTANVASINTGLGETIALQKAERAAAGLTGGSSFSSALAEGSTIGARQQAALDAAKYKTAALNQNATDLASTNNSAAQLTSSVNEKNAADYLTTSDQNLSNQLSNAGTAFNQIQSAQKTDSAKSTSAYSDIQALINTLGYANIGSTQATSAVSSDVQTDTSGQALGTSISQLGGTLMNYYLNKNGSTVNKNGSTAQGTTTPTTTTN